MWALSDRLVPLCHSQVREYRSKGNLRKRHLSLSLTRRAKASSSEGVLLVQGRSGYPDGLIVTAGTQHLDGYRGTSRCYVLEHLEPRIAARTYHASSRIAIRATKKAPLPMKERRLSAQGTFEASARLQPHPIIHGYRFPGSSVRAILPVRYGRRVTAGPSPAISSYSKGVHAATPTSSSLVIFRWASRMCSECEA